MSVLSPPIHSRMSAIQAILMAIYNSGRNLPHNVAGRERELFVKYYLKEIFPSHIRFISGVIIDANHNITGQLDLVIERLYAPSFPALFGDDRLILGDNVAVVIEVKSNLSSQWDEVIKTTSLVRNLHYKPVHTGMAVRGLPDTVPVIAVGFKGYSRKETIRERLNNTNENERPSGVLCIESGALVYDDGKCKAGSSGPDGMFIFSAILNRLISLVLFNANNMESYIRK